jgi:hypothetical protein
MLDAKPAAGFFVFGAGFRRVHVSDCALEAHCRLSSLVMPSLIRLSTLS